MNVTFEQRQTIRDAIGQTFEQELTKLGLKVLGGGAAVHGDGGDTTLEVMWPDGTKDTASVDYWLWTKDNPRKAQVLDFAQQQDLLQETAQRWAGVLLDGEPTIAPVELATLEPAYSKLMHLAICAAVRSADEDGSEYSVLDICDSNISFKARDLLEQLVAELGKE